MSNMGMDLGTNFSYGQNVWTKVLGMVVRSGYPGTVLTSDTVVMDVTRNGTLTARWTNSSTLNTNQYRVVRNGTTVILGPFNTGTTNSATIAVTAGDTLELQAFSSNFSGSNRISQAGSTNTFLTFDMLPSLLTIGGDRGIGWNLAADTTVNKLAQGDLQIGWGLSTDTEVDKLANASLQINWGMTADARKGDHYTIAPAAPLVIGWNMAADLLYTPKPVNPPSIFTFNDVAASVHTVDGRKVGDFECNVIGGFTWGRTNNEVSTCDLTVLTQGLDVAEVVEDIRPWLHWVTFWHDDVPVWTGPIQKVTIGTNTAAISARDPSTFMWRTRIPISRSWDETSPADIAYLLWLRMLELHGIRTTPVVISDVITEVFSMTATADSRLLNQFMDDLVKVGLQWTVVAGRPVLGVFPRTPVTELAECDFMVDISRIRDGSQTYNDIRVQGKNYVQSVVAPLAGLHLQNLVSLDDLFGISNIQKAATAYAVRQAQIRDVLDIPGSASLHPEAPVTLDDLVPGKMFKVTAQDVTNLMRLDSMQVSGTPSTFDVQVTLVADNPVTELGNAIGGTGL